MEKEKSNTARGVRNSLLLLLTALIWGVAFVAQSVSMDYVEPLTFIFLRSVIGALFLYVFIVIADKLKKKKSKYPGKEPIMVSSWKDKKLWAGGILCGLFLFSASFFQQTGIKYTSVGKAGFITTFYIIIVPLLGIVFKKYCGILTWIGVVVALIGLYFLCMNERLQIQAGDFYILICAFLFSCQIMAIDHFNRWVDGVKMSCIQFLVCAVLGCMGMFLFESPNINRIVSAAVPVLYTGIMSTGIGYTLQTVGQKGLNPTVASLILSMESVFSALAGFIILHQILSKRELLGCVLMFVAIILAQLPDINRKV